jgi:hypothetical protein
MVAQVHQHQAVSMALEVRHYLYNSIAWSSSKCYRCRFQEKKQATLNEFIGVEMLQANASVRVQPDESLEAEICDGRRRIRGHIMDISSGRICIFTFAHDMYGLSFRLGWEVSVDFTPPNMDTMVHFLGVITNINYHNGLYLHRLGLKIYPSPEIKPLIEEYVGNQQKVILDEIELKYQLMCQDYSS